MASGSAQLGNPSNAASWSSKLNEAQQLTIQATKQEFAKDYSHAFTSYVRAGELYLWLVRSFDAKNTLHTQGFALASKNGIDTLPGEGTDVKARIRRAADKVLNRAQLIKSLRTDVKPVQRLILSDGEQARTLQHASDALNVHIPIWHTVPPASSFQGPPFSLTGRNTPRLAPLHVQRGATYRRRSDKLFWSDLPLFDIECQLDGRNIVQDVVNDCSYVAALEVAVDHDKKWGTRLATSPLYPKDALGNPCWSANGKYIVKLLFNGCFRSLEIDESIPCDKRGRPLCAVAYQREANGMRLQLWPALLEKAYLSLHGGYDFGGSNSSIDLHALTGWIPEQVGFRHPVFQREKVWNKLSRAFNQGHVMITAGTSKNASRDNSDDNVHLVDSHNYAVLAMNESAGKRDLLLMNPWRRPTMSRREWTQEMRAMLPDHEVSSPTTDEPETFAMSWDAACTRLDSLHLSWNPALHRHSTAFHSIWPVSGMRTIPQTSLTGQNTQVMLRVNVPGLDDGQRDEKPPMTEVVLHLARHLTRSSQSMDRRTEWIAIHAFDSKDQLRSRDNLSRGTYVDSNHTLTRFHARSGGQYVIVASRQVQQQAVKKDTTVDSINEEDATYTVTAYSNAQVTFAEMDNSFAYDVQLDGQWTARTAGGSVLYPSFMHNPQYVVRIPKSSSSATAMTSRMRIVVETSRDIAVQVMLAWCSKDETNATPSSAAVRGDTAAVRRVDHVAPGDIICSSGAYNYGLAIAETTALKQDTSYVLVVSTYTPNIEGAFTLRIQTQDVKPDVRPMAAEGAGMHQQRMRDQWSTANGTACGSPRFGSYRQNPSFVVHVDRSTRFTVRLIASSLLLSTMATISGSQDAHAEEAAVQRRPPHVNVAILDRRTGREMASSGPYADHMCGVALHDVLLEAGTYVIVSSTFEPNVEASFTLHIYTDRSVAVQRAVQ